jgi:glycosyltransferase involved in cell wall biosynthesis
MRVSCLISHYNYGEFVGEALASVLAQTRVPDEIVLVDDGSSESHRARVREAAASSPRVTLIEKPNEGQLSCFRVGLERSTGDIVFFLDADDRWKPEYVATVLELLERRRDVGFVASARTEFHPDGRVEVHESASRDLGFSVIRCLEAGGAWIGAPTSCLAIRRSVLDQIFPVPNPQAWRVCADEALVYGASLVGARKYFLGQPLVEYRVHGANAFFDRKDSPERAYMRRLEGRRLTEALRLRMSLPVSLAKMAHYEFRTIERPTRDEYRTYCRLVHRSELPLRRKLRVLTGLFHAYHVEKRT